MRGERRIDKLMRTGKSDSCTAGGIAGGGGGGSGRDGPGQEEGWNQRGACRKRGDQPDRWKWGEDGRYNQTNKTKKQQDWGLRCWRQRRGERGRTGRETGEGAGGHRRGRQKGEGGGGGAGKRGIEGRARPAKGVGGEKAGDKGSRKDGGGQKGTQCTGEGKERGRMRIRLAGEIVVVCVT